MAIPSGGGGVVGLRESVVKIFVRSVGDDFTSPWKKRPQSSGTGSGLCIDCEARRVLTNAHVVAGAVMVRVRKYGDPVRYPATVLCISPQCDLAVLEVPADAFWAGGVAAIELTEEVPSLDSDVLTVGYPMGGDNISVTRGVVSRIDLMDYTFSPVGGERLPVIQVDAAINPGNSGGPVIGSSGRAVGVAFAGLGSGENIGYVIPGSVALFFLRGFAATGGFAGLCSLGVRMQASQSAALRRFHRLANDGSAREATKGTNGEIAGGVLIVAVAPLSAAAAAGLNAGDVLCAVDGVPIGEDGTVPFRSNSSGERIGFDYLVTRKVVGEGVSVDVISAEQQGHAEVRTVHLQVAPVRKLVPRSRRVDALPSYFVVGGLVFVPLSLPWLEDRFGRRMGEAPPNLLQKLEEFKAEEDEEVVVLAKVLAADVNYGFEDFQCMQLLEFGFYGSNQGASEGSMTKVRSLQHLREMVLTPGAEEPGYHRFRLANNLEVVLDATECKSASEDILRQHAIPMPCSEDLLTEAELQQLRRMPVGSRL